MSNEVSHNPEAHANNENPLDKNAIENLIAQGIANALPLIIKAVKNPIEPTKAMSSKHTRDDSFNHSVNSDNNDIIKTPFPKKKKAMTLGCTYKEFLACKPTEFAGSEGATAALRWLEKTEAVLTISKCAKEDKVMYASNLFKEEALEWWNTILQAKGRTMAYAINWEEFKEVVERKFCPPYEKERITNKFLNHKMIDVNCREYTTTFFEYARMVPTLASPEPVLISRYIWGLVSEIRDIVKAVRPQTIEEAVELANMLTDGLIRTREENKKKELAQKISQEFKKKETEPSLEQPICRNSNKTHSGRCRFRNTPYCDFCKMTGHIEEECRRKTNVCYNCGETGHIKPYCPKLTKASDNKARTTNGAKKNALAYALTTQEVEMIPDVVTDIYLS